MAPIRAASTRITRLTSRTSEFNPQVTLFEPADQDDSPRRPKLRAKTEVKAEPIPDLEDLGREDSTSTRKAVAKKASPKKVTKRAASSSSPTPDERKTKPVKKDKAVPQKLVKPHPAPPKWQETYDAIKEMRSRFIAPVDTMGCQRAQVEETEPKNKRYATLVALMLSSQTKDEVMHAATNDLRKALGGSISIEAMIAASDKIISQAIKKVGFWRKKTEYLQKAAIKLRDDFNSDVPKTADELCSLPGVGPKMAFLTLQIAWNQNDGIGVDVHVHRITNLLRWHKPPTKGPEETRLNLQSWLPKELYGDINHMMVGFGQVICLPTGPRCDMCDLSVKKLCPSAGKVNVKNRKPIKFTPAQESPPQVLVALEEVEEKFVSES